MKAKKSRSIIFVHKQIYKVYDTVTSHNWQKTELFTTKKKLFLCSKETKNYILLYYNFTKQIKTF